MRVRQGGVPRVRVCWALSFIYTVGRREHILLIERSLATTCIRFFILFNLFPYLIVSYDLMQRPRLLTYSR